MRRLALAVLAALVAVPSLVGPLAGHRGEPVERRQAAEDGIAQDTAEPPNVAPAAERESVPDSAAQARDEALDALTAEIGSKLRCPVCRQQSVSESSSRIARDMQQLIRDKLEAGETPEEIEAYFLAAYGDWILLRPEPRGVNILVYLLPALAFVLGGTWLALRMRAQRGVRGDVALSPADADATTSDLDEADRAWLEQAVRGS